MSFKLSIIFSSAFGILGVDLAESLFFKGVLGAF
jgi:hypothetical protein